MVSLRRFTAGDAPLLREKREKDASLEEVAAMIRSWESGSFQGRYFEMLALTEEGGVVGSVSLYGRTKSVASLGVEVFPDERGRGYAFEGMRAILELAKERGFGIVQDQVRVDNAASIALHEKLGFETDGYVFKNAKGRDVLIYLLCL